MATVTNTQPRLFWGPQIPGHPTPKWIPGVNDLDPKYWKAAKNHHAVKAWLREEWIKVDLDAKAPARDEEPSAEHLATLSDHEVDAAARDPKTPPTWLPALEAERERRMRGRVPSPHSGRKSLSGLRVDDALPLIEAETDEEVLVSWADTDERKTIHEAIERRLEALEAANDDEEGEQE